jgi:hypothetical protein
VLEIEVYREWGWLAPKGVDAARRLDGPIKEHSLKSTVELKVNDDRGVQPIIERIPARETSPNRFELLGSPGLVEGLATGDEVEVLGDGTFVVTKRGGNVSVWLYLDRNRDDERVVALVEQVQKIGGYLDGGTHASLIFTIPVGAGFSRIESIFQRFVASCPAATWMFANVYDPADGQTPLNWWT